MAGLLLELNPSQMVAGAAQAQEALSDVGAEAVKTQSAVDRMARTAGPAMREASEATGAFAGNARQLGWQVSQIAQQGAATGQWAQAFALQLSDMAMILGAGGGVGLALGVLASVTLPLLSMAFSDTTDEARQSEDALNDLMDTLQDFNGNARIGAATVENLRKEYGLWAEEIRQTAQWMAQVDASVALDSLSRGTIDFSATLDRMTAANKNATDAMMARFKAEQAVANGIGSELDVQNQIDLMNQYNAEVDDLAASLGMSSQQAFALQASLDAVQSSGSMTELADNASAVLAQIEQWYPAGALMPPEMVKIAQMMQDIQSAAARGVTTMEGFTPALQGATVAANDLYGVMFDMTQLSFGNLSAIPGAGDMFTNPLYAANGMAPPTPPKPAARSGGGARSVIQGQTIALQELLDLQEQVTIGWDDYAEAGGDAFDRLITGTGNLHDALLQLLDDIELLAVKGVFSSLFPSLDASQSFGSMITSLITGGFHDTGGTIPMGTTGLVGENGPEPVTVTPHGAVVTSRQSYSAQPASPQATAVDVQVGVSVDDDGKIKAYVKSAQAVAVNASVATVKQNLGNWNNQLQAYGAL